LFADQGGFDAPQTYGVGVAYNLTPQRDVTAEYQRIDYSDVNSVGNPSFAKLSAGKLFGSSDGPGFGWRDVNVFRNFCRIIAINHHVAAEDRVGRWSGSPGEADPDRSVRWLGG
jgi:hypothetical protein